VTASSDETTETAWLNDDEQCAWWALLEVGSGLFDALSCDLRATADLTLEDYEVLHLLSEQDARSLRIGTLAEMMLASRTRLSQRIDRMATRGLVKREPCPEDGRAINVVLTDAGYDLLVEIAPIHLESVRRLTFDHLTSADVKALGSGLSKVAQHLHEVRASPSRPSAEAD